MCCKMTKTDLNNHQWVSTPRKWVSTHRFWVSTPQHTHNGSQHRGSQHLDFIKKRIAQHRVFIRPKSVFQHEGNMQIESLNMHVALVHALSTCVMCNELLCAAALHITHDDSTTPHHVAMTTPFH